MQSEKIMRKYYWKI